MHITIPGVELDGRLARTTGIITSLATIAATVGAPEGEGDLDTDTDTDPVRDPDGVGVGGRRCERSGRVL